MSCFFLNSFLQFIIPGLLFQPKRIKFSNLRCSDHDELLTSVLAHMSVTWSSVWLALQCCHWRWIQPKIALGKNVDTNQHTSCIPSEIPNINTINFVTASRAEVQTPFWSSVHAVSPILSRLGHKCLPCGNRKKLLSLFPLSKNMTLATDMTKNMSIRRNPSI